jgi:hypothetical protein
MNDAKQDEHLEIPRSHLAIGWSTRGQFVHHCVTLGPRLGVAVYSFVLGGDATVSFACTPLSLKYFVKSQPMYLLILKRTHAWFAGKLSAAGPHSFSQRV